MLLPLHYSFLPVEVRAWCWFIILSSLIAVVGLGTHAFGTFRALEGDKMWLRDFLRKDIPNIRVLLYGYESQVDNSSTIETIEELARACLNILHNFRVNTQVGVDSYGSPYIPAHIFLDWRSSHHIPRSKSRWTRSPRGWSIPQNIRLPSYTRQN